MVSVRPVSINASLNSTVQFNCEAQNAIIVHFYIGNTPAVDEINEKKGFYESPQDTINGTTTRSLVVFAQKTNNNTNITCDIFPGNVKSEIATLRIQGKQYNYSSVV